MWPYALNLAWSIQHWAAWRLRGTYHSAVGDHPDHQSTPLPLLAFLTQLEDVSAIRSKSNYRQDLGPSRILRTNLDTVALLQFRVGKGDTKDGRLGSLISAKMGGIDVNIVNTGKVGCQSNDHPGGFSDVV